MARLETELFPYFLRVNHPRFYGFIPGPSNFIGVLADALAAGFNVFNGTWIGGSGGAEMERATIGWVRDALGFPKESGGLFASGGSAANVIGLAVARHARLNGEMSGARLYASSETHSSVERGLRILGFRPEQLVRVSVAGDFRIDMNALAQAIAADRKAGLNPFVVVANAGTTNTGAVDPLGEIADLCAREDMWLHVDGAYGACAAFSPRGKAALAGVERADSISFDPHKWLFQPFEIGGVLVRADRDLHAAFDVSATYMRDTRKPGRGINYGERGVQLTRSLRALKLWMTFEVFGAEEIAAAIDRGFAAAETAEALLRARPHWRLMSPASMGIVGFRAAPQGWSPDACDRLNAAIAARVRAEGRDMIATTELKGRVGLRMCPINPRLDLAELEGSISRLDEAARAAMSDPSWDRR
jgi:glutamate/tyrosine decarboxylase-like PLP-dependent enzyme